MTLSKEFAPEVLNADTHMTSTPSSTTHAIPVKAPMRHSCAMTTASKQCILQLQPQCSYTEHMELILSPHITEDACIRRGRCARGAACRYSHDFSALTATSPLMPALTAAAAAAAIAQISLDPHGLLPQLAPYLQPYLSSTTQHASLQQQLLQNRAPNSTLSPHSFPFAKAAFPHPSMAR